jgi:hypothetical protein
MVFAQNLLTEVKTLHAYLEAHSTKLIRPCDLHRSRWVKPMYVRLRN